MYEHEELWQDYWETKSGRALDRLIEQYRPFVKHIIKIRCKNMVSLQHRFDDCVAAGLEGLWQAIERYKPTMACSFLTFAGYRVYGAIIDWVRKNLGNRRLRNYEPKRSCTNEYRIARRHINSPKSMHAMIEDDETIRREFVTKDDMHPDYIAIKNECHKTVLKLIEDLRVDNERAAHFVSEYYLFGKTMKEIGENNGVTESRASQILREARNMLHEYARERHVSMVNMAIS